MNETKEFTIKQLIALLITIAGVLGAILTFLVTLPFNENIVQITTILVIMIAVITGLVKMFKEIDTVVEREVSNRL